MSRFSFSAGLVSLLLGSHLLFAAEVLYNGITLPDQWPPISQPTQAYRVPGYITSPPSLIPINVGRQLFVDDFLIETTTLTRAQHRPVMHPQNPVLPATALGEAAMPFSDGVWYDPADRLYKMWYWGPNLGPWLSYAYSFDGKTWIKPSLPNAVVKDTNIVINFGGGRDSGTVWMDLEDPNPAQKFKGFFYGGGGKLRVFYSPDGIVWTEQNNRIYSISDRSTVFWNPFRKVWVESARSSANLPATSLLPTRASRSRYYFESKDLTNWLPNDDGTNSFWTSTDERDPAYPGTATLPDLYNLDAVAYESVMVGLFSLYYPEPSPLLVELNAGFSRDGYQWVRPTRGAAGDAFIPATNRDGDWNAFNTQSVGGGFVVNGDELWFYFSGRSGRHGTPYNTQTFSTGLAKLRRDGFYSMDADAAGGILTTRKVTFNGSNLFVNVNNPNGSLQAEILDEKGAVIAPFTRSNSQVVRTNSTKQQMMWGGADLSSLGGRPVRFRFYLTSGELYAFWVTPDAGGASFGYVAAGGPGFTSNRDMGSNTPVPAPDTQKPTVPANLVASVSTTPSVSLTWAASTDNVGVSSYRVYRNGALLATTTTPVWTDTTVAAGSTYTYTVSAQDAAGNDSGQSVAATGTIPAPPPVTPPPSTPPPGPVTPPATSLKYLKIEAESAVIARPWQTLYLGPANVSGGFFARSTVDNTGTLTYTINVPTAGTYKLWARGSSVYGSASFYVSIDGGPESAWSTSTWKDGFWSWLAVQTPVLTAGNHTIRLRAGIAYTCIDALMLSNDPAFIPAGVNGR